MRIVLFYRCSYSDPAVNQVLVAVFTATIVIDSIGNFPQFGGVALGLIFSKILLFKI